MDLLGPSDIDALLRAHGVRASRALGQHFLADPNTARRIARLAEIEPDDRVIEVGPGIGSLTLALAEAGAEVVAVERDRHVLPLLREVLARSGAESAVTLVEADALTADYDTIAPSERWAMVSNLPYNIATPLLAHLLDDVPRIDRFLVMVQREVAERIAAPLGTRASGGITVKVAYHATARIVGRVPPSVFVPRPRVESALLALHRHVSPPVDVRDPAAMFDLVRAGFAQRRKTLGRALRSTLGDDARGMLNAAGIDPRSRAEQLTLEQWADLTRETEASRA